MILSAFSSPDQDASADLLAVACDEDFLRDPATIDVLDAALGGTLRRVIAGERFRGNAGQQLSLNTFGKIAASHLCLLGMGPCGTLSAASVRGFAARAVRLANGIGAIHIALRIPAATLATFPPTFPVLQHLSTGAMLGNYRFDKYLSEEKRTPRSATTVDILTESPPPPNAAVSIARGKHLADAVALARDLVNEPPAELTPRRLAEVAQAQARRHGLDVKILDASQCRALGMGLFLAVAQGSAEEPRFIHLSWIPKTPAKKRIVLVGKGVTFDSGGLSLKTNDSMLDMKTDMAGSATVIAAISAIAAEGLSVEVHALAACTENMPGGKSYKLGDVFRSKLGKTVEINNTDAEGRLTLADALTYGLETKPDEIFDFATLTGACMVALGPHIAGVMSNNDALGERWLDAAKTAGEEMWRLPLPGRLMEQLKSDVADMKNTGERWGGALTAGLFLREFVGTTPWVHVDLAGPSTVDKESGEHTKGGTGFGIFTIFEHCVRLCGV